MTDIIQLQERIAELEKKLADKEWASEKTNNAIKILYKELEIKNEELKKLDALKTQFVSNVSHEFRSPLAIIREALALISDGTLGDVEPKQRNMLDISIETVERLSRLVNDMLDIARIESGKVELKKESVDIVFLTDEIIKAYAVTMSKRGITVAKEYTIENGVIEADRDKISEVFINILHNAIKYTPDAGVIRVVIDGSDARVRVAITDSGPGIPEEYLDSIFDKFVRITSEKQEGTGLGLPIANDIVRLHKGSMAVASKPDQGATFSFTLPRHSIVSEP